MHMNRLSFTLKCLAESVVYARHLPEAISIRRVFCTVGEKPAVDGQSIAAVTNMK